jgi:cysteine-rich repeat protein
VRSGPDNAADGQCTPECDIAVCGDGYIYEGFEDCDDGNASNNDACVAGCEVASCGDGFVHEGVEQCDDANDEDTDDCTSACVAAMCGDGVVQADEQCDDANVDNSGGCPGCQFAFCGDGHVQTGIESCDDGNTSSADACTHPGCAEAYCGDGIVWEGVEACDDSNGDDTDACPTTCAVATCGDGFVQEGVEECDDADAVNNNACDNDCNQTDCLTDWLVGEFECDPIEGGCLDSEPGYHWKGLFTALDVQYACWWHTKNEGWNTGQASNYWHLAERFNLATNAGQARWCYSFDTDDPCGIGACGLGPLPANYFAQNNIGAFGWCGGNPWESGGFVCIPAPVSVECPG